MVGNVHKAKSKLIEEKHDSRLRHRIHQWSASTLMRVLENKPIKVVTISEAYTSSRDPFTGAPISKWEPRVTRCAPRGSHRVKVVKRAYRVTFVNGKLLERDYAGAINISLKYLGQMGAPSVGLDGAPCPPI